MRDFISLRYTIRDGSQHSVSYVQNVRNVVLHNRNITEIDLSPLKYCPDVKAVTLKSNHIQYLDLEPLSNCPKLKSFILAENRISHLRLEPLQDLFGLEEIDLSWNRLSTINLEPLQGKKELRLLDLSSNKLSSLELYPLATCDNLRELNLTANDFQELNLAPLLMCSNLRKLSIQWNFQLQPTIEVGHKASSFSAVVVDALLRNALQYGKPLWLKDSRLLSEIRIPDYDTIIKKLGWEEVRDRIRRVLRTPPLAHTFEIQKKLFDGLEMGELFGLDMKISDILCQIPDLVDVQEGLSQFYTKIVKQLIKQFNNGGSTLFFNVDKLSTTRGAILVEPLVKRRKQEIEELKLASQGNRIDLIPLWLTGYGFEILRKLGAGRTTSLQGFKSIKEIFHVLGFDLDYQENSQIDSAAGKHISSELHRLIIDSINSGGQHLSVQS